MKHSNNNEHAQKLAENNKNNLLIETDKEDFKKWIKEEDVKYISKELVKTPNRKVKISKLSDGIVWNIFNLQSDKDAVLPEKNKQMRLWLQRHVNGLQISNVTQCR